MASVEGADRRIVAPAVSSQHPMRNVQATLGWFLARAKVYCGVQTFKLYSVASKPGQLLVLANFSLGEGIPVGAERLERLSGRLLAEMTEQLKTRANIVVTKLVGAQSDDILEQLRRPEFGSPAHYAFDHNPPVVILIEQK